MSGQPIMSGAGRAEQTDEEDEFFDEGDEAIVATIKELLETRVRPAVAQDGGDITFRGFKDGTVFLNMKGACSGCPSSTATLSTACRTCCATSYRKSKRSNPSDPKWIGAREPACRPAHRLLTVWLHFPYIVFPYSLSRCGFWDRIASVIPKGRSDLDMR